MLKDFLWTAGLLAVGTLICLIIAGFLGEDPSHVMSVLVQGAFGSLSDIGYTLFYATPLIFTGLSVALAFQAGLFNIGAEGQLNMGALLTAAVGIMWAKLPQPLGAIVGILAASIGGGMWGAIAGWLKARRGSHEVITTIMLNFLASAICSFFILYVFKNPLSQNPETAEVGSGFHVLSFANMFNDAPVNLGLILALLACIVFWVMVFKTPWGFQIRMLGASPETARRAGVPVERRLIEVFFFSGLFAGLVGVNEVLGFVHKFRDQFSAGYGFIGIAVALLGNNRPVGIILSALVFGALQKGALDLELDTDHITRDLAVVLQGIMILLVAARPYLQRLVERKVRLRIPARMKRPKAL